MSTATDPTAPTRSAQRRPRPATADGRGRRRPAASPAGSTTAPARAKPVGYLLKKVFPDHWSFMLGEIALYSLRSSCC